MVSCYKNKNFETGCSTMSFALECCVSKTCLYPIYTHTSLSACNQSSRIVAATRARAAVAPIIAGPFSLFPRALQCEKMCKQFMCTSSARFSRDRNNTKAPFICGFFVRDARRYYCYMVYRTYTHYVSRETTTETTT